MVSMAAPLTRQCHQERKDAKQPSGPDMLQATTRFQLRRLTCWTCVRWVCWLLLAVKQGQPKKLYVAALRDQLSDELYRQGQEACRSFILAQSCCKPTQDLT